MIRRFHIVAQRGRNRNDIVPSSITSRPRYQPFEPGAYIFRRLSDRISQNRARRRDYGNQGDTRDVSDEARDAGGRLPPRGRNGGADEGAGQGLDGDVEVNDRELIRLSRSGQEEAANGERALRPSRSGRGEENPAHRAR